VVQVPLVAVIEVHPPAASALPRRPGSGARGKDLHPGSFLESGNVPQEAFPRPPWDSEGAIRIYGIEGTELPMGMAGGVDLPVES